jgi:ribose 5-phosphate isomerase B
MPCLGQCLNVGIDGRIHATKILVSTKNAMILVWPKECSLQKVHARPRTAPDSEVKMRVGIAADHGGYEMKQKIYILLNAKGHQVVDFGNLQYDRDDDYPDFAIPLARAVAAGVVERGIQLCGSGIGASIAANKIEGVRAAVCHDDFSSRQGVEDDDMNILCLGSLTTGVAVAWNCVKSFLAANFSGAERHRRRPAKVRAIRTNSTVVYGIRAVPFGREASVQLRSGIVEE